jgi:hypothetical protein
MNEQEDNRKFCDSVGIKSLTKMAIDAGESRRQATKAKRMILDAKKELEKAENIFTKREKERVDIEKEYKRLSKKLGAVVTNRNKQ